jgi:hypothetical protein
LDILFSEPEEPRLTQDADGTVHKIEDDAALAAVLAKSGVAVLATRILRGSRQHAVAGNSSGLPRHSPTILNNRSETFAKSLAAAGATATRRIDGERFVPEQPPAGDEGKG